MPLIKMGPAARRARVGSTRTIQRLLREAGIPLVEQSPGVFAVEEEDLARYLQAGPGEARGGTEPKPREQAAADVAPKTPKASPAKSRKVDRRR